MCNARTLTSNIEAIRQQFRFAVNRVGNMALLPSIWPGQDSPVIRIGADDTRELVSMNWGFVLPQEGKAAKRVTNARDDKLASSPFWRNSFEKRRCLVPTSSFCEWTKDRPKVPYWFGLKGREPRPLFALAGVWLTWRGKLKADGESQEMTLVAIVTTRPNPLVARIHPARMPVMLVAREDCDTWLEGSPREAISLAKPYPADAMVIVAKGETHDEGVSLLVE